MSYQPSKTQSPPSVMRLPGYQLSALRFPLSAFLLLLFCMLAPAHADYYPLKLKDARGKTITIKAKPMRVVSLAPSNTEILYSVGLNTRIAGVTHYCNYPAAAKKKPKIGDMKVSVEAVLALKPDLVLAHATMNDYIIPRLEKLGLTVFAIDPKTLPEVIRDIRTVGKITARPKTADSVAKKIEKAIAEVKSARAGKPKVNALVVVQTDPLWVAGPDTLPDEMLRLANASNAAHDARPGFNTFSRELAVTRNPDVIFVSRPEDIDFFLKSPAWRSVKAVKSKRIHALNSGHTLRAGPRLAIGLRELAAKLDK